jgi:DNA-binding NarL/FixJ family response regulator
MEQAMVAVCSADPFIVLGVERLLKADSRFAVIPPHRAREARVAIVVASCVDDEAIDLLSRVSRASSASIVLIVDKLDENDLAAIVQRRVVSVLARSAVSPDTLCAAIDQALVSATPKPELIEHLMSQLERVSCGILEPKPASPSLLAPRERDLLKLLADGYDTAEIALKLAYSERTIKNIVHGLLERLELRNRAHAVAYAMRAGVL